METVARLSVSVLTTDVVYRFWSKSTQFVELQKPVFLHQKPVSGENKPVECTQDGRVALYTDLRRDQRQKIFQFPKGGPQGNAKIDPLARGRPIDPRGKL